MRVIKCKCGKAFSACVSDYVDAEWKLQEAYYKAQGCIVEELEMVQLSECDCEHAPNIDHDFENLIEQVKYDTNRRSKKVIKQH